ncbi:hypothetical protein BJV78DRAFT_1223252 [Lactifluus subvellereus]|nr:hypothetical protein BJV78DRAFT_1223252 [Lactifluus subvellereus]
MSGVGLNKVVNNCWANHNATETGGGPKTDGEATRGQRQARKQAEAEVGDRKHNAGSGGK